MDVPTYFEDFLAKIRPSGPQREAMAEAHNDLRDRLEKDEAIKRVLVSTFIQGSYRRHTGLLGTKEHPCDVDLVVVTSIPTSTPPTLALEAFHPFLEKNYKGRYEPQGRSWCIHWNEKITLDLVPTSAPSESNMKLLRAFGDGFRFQDPFFERGRLTASDPLLEEYRRQVKAGWQSEPLFIPDREVKIWEPTHPLAQIAWTADKNSRCDGFYISVVRAIKWWRRMKAPEPKYPKGYPLEHLVGVCCPDGIASVAEGVAEALDAIVNKFSREAAAGTKPYLRDHGVEQDVFKRVPAKDFVGFYQKTVPAAAIAQRARAAETVSQCVSLWRELFGEAFPKPPEDKKTEPNSPGSFSPRVAVGAPAARGRFA